jgi:hypothetical protein
LSGGGWGFRGERGGREEKGREGREEKGRKVKMKREKGEK